MSDQTPRLAGAAASGPGGSIYDLGYQGYTGPRLGRAPRPARSSPTPSAPRTASDGAVAPRSPRWPWAGSPSCRRSWPSAIAALAAQAGAGSAFDRSSPVRYETYHGLTITLLFLFCAAQAPELFGRDQRFGVLPLYFSRALTRVDYAVARIVGLMVALLIVDLLPQVILFVGRVLVAADPVTGIGNEAPAIPRFLAQVALTAAVLGGMASLIASWTPRRAYATAGIIAVAIIPPVVVALANSLSGGDIARLVILLSPGDVLDGANAWIFGALSENPVVATSGVPGPVYVAAGLVWAAATIGLTIRRYQRISA